MRERRKGYDEPQDGDSLSQIEKKVLTKTKNEDR